MHVMMSTTRWLRHGPSHRQVAEEIEGGSEQVAVGMFMDADLASAHLPCRMSSHSWPRLAPAAKIQSSLGCRRSYWPG